MGVPQKLAGLFHGKSSCITPMTIMAGWWLSPTPLKNDGKLVSWDYDIPNYMENKEMFKTTNQIYCNSND